MKEKRLKTQANHSTIHIIQKVLQVGLIKVLKSQVNHHQNLVKKRKRKRKKIVMRMKMMKKIVLKNQKRKKVQMMKMMMRIKMRMRIRIRMKIKMPNMIKKGQWY